MFPVLCFGQSAMEYWQSGVDKYNEGDYYGAIADYTKSIDMVDLDMTLYQRGWAYYMIKDFKSAISDFSKVIESKFGEEYYADSYKMRGISKENLELPCCPDFKKACEFGDCENYNKGCK